MENVSAFYAVVSCRDKRTKCSRPRIAHMERRLFLKIHRVEELIVTDLENISAFYTIISSRDKKKPKQNILFN